MPMNNVVISQNSNEKQFIAAFIKSIMGESVFASQHSLVCKIGNDTNYADSTTVTDDTEIDEQLTTVFGSGANTPVIWFCIDDYILLQMLRGSRLSNGGGSYYFYTYFNNTRVNDKALGFFTSSYSNYPSYSSTALRAYKYQIVSNTNALFIVFGEGRGVFPLTSGTTYQSIFIYKKGTELAYGNTPQTNLTNQDNIPLSVVNRVPYINNSTDPTDIEVIQNKVATASAGNNKVITMDNIWDSTYNSAVMFPVNIGNNQHVYLDNYTLMPI